MTETTQTKTGISRRNFLKTGTAAAAGAAVGSGVITGFPTIWAQNPITLRQFGTGVSNLNAIAEKCTADLGITLEMTATDSDAAAQRAVTQPEGRAAYPSLRRRRAPRALGGYAPASYPGPAGLGGNYPAPTPLPGVPVSATVPLGQTATQYSEVDPNWKPPSP